MSAVAATGPAALLGLDPATYHPHRVHADDRTYPETNCYTDLLIELLHARGDEPLAALGSTVRLDFETDQWTFFKPAQADLEDLFGVDIHESQPYRSLPAQIEETLRDGRTITVEVDGWYLPDTSATSHHREHVKTTIAIEAIDPARERLVYFHNTSLYAVDGADYRGVLRTGTGNGAETPLPYVELVSFDAGPRLAGAALREAALAATRRHLGRLRPGNPYDRFGTRLQTELPRLLEGDEAAYHAYAFATVRMAGAGFGLLAAHVDWLLGPDGRPVSEPLERIVEGSKLLAFKLARRRAFDPGPTIDAMGAAWVLAIAELTDRLAGR